MSKFPKIIHLEITDVCQAACPQCAREIDINFDKNVTHYLTVPDIKNILSNLDIKRLDKMYMCGNYGDPAAGQVIEIIEYFRGINNSIVIGMNTNGGLQSPKWWEGLAKKLNQPKDYVVFSIDGLKDTNHVYRKNVIWERVMANADSFIKSGGLAHWDMLVFEHNEHQVNACQQLAKDMRFYFFRAKVSRRHHDYPISFLKNPKFWQDTLIISDSIRCKALEEKSLYVSAQGIVHPCCWLGYRNGPLLKDFDVIQQNWNTSPNIICKKTCSTVNSVSSFENQWQKEIQLIIK